MTPTGPNDGTRSAADADVRFCDEIEFSAMLRFMTARLTEIVIDCRDPLALARFWASVLDYHVVRAEDGQVEIAPWQHEPSDLARQVRQAPVIPTLVFVAVPEDKTAKNRLHLDIRPAGYSHDAEVERLIGLGARRHDLGAGLQPWAVLIDPEGNEFCVLGSLDASV